MGGLFGGSPPAPDNTALEEARKERDELRKKNDAKARNIRGRQTGPYALLAYKGGDELGTKLGG